jgi:hypothetical protein
MRPKTVLYVGNYQAPWCTEVHIARDLEALGHTVVRFQEPPGGGDHSTLDQIENAAMAVDLVLWTRTWGLPAEATQLWGQLEARGIRTASYHLDLYVGLQREHKVASDPFWTTGTVFTPDGDPKSEAWFRRHGINHHYMPPAVVSDECLPGTYRSELDHDVVFVGSKHYHPEWRHRPALLAWLEDTYGDRFRRYGGDAQIMRGQDLNDLYASAKVVVGDSLCLAGHQNYWSDRYYETIGRGGFLIAPRIDGLERHFDDGEHLVLYDFWDFDQLQESIDFYLNQPHERERIAKNGQAHVAAHHTYRVRLQEALAHLEAAA